MLKKTASKKEKYIWNMLGSFTNALSSMVLAIIVNRISGAELGGVFAFAFSNAQLMMTIGAFEVRPLQSTDINEKYMFSQYFTLRVLTCILMLLCNLCYIGIGGFTGVKGYTLFFVCFYKMMESFTDVFSGMYQQHDRIDLSGKVHTIRIICCTFGFFLILLTTDNLVAASVSLGLISLIVFFVYDLRLFRIFETVKIGTSFKDLGILVMECLPLFLSSFIMMYINNAPKYAINEYYSDEIQNIYNILFMPAFVINLFSLFVFRPMLVELTEFWNTGKIAIFLKKVKGMCLLILGLTLGAMAGAYLLGIPVLELIYGVQLQEYRMELVLIMITGGISALSTFLYYIITVMRKQKYLLIGYGCSFLIALCLPKVLVKKFGITGAVASCTSALLVLVVAFFIIIAVHVIKKKKETSERR